MTDYQNIIYPLHAPLVLTGMMGVGKSSIGMSLANHYNMNFVDSDKEIVRAAQMSITEIFADFGEGYFRAGEERVIKRIFEEQSSFIMASGGGAIMNPSSMALFKHQAVTLWLDVEMDVLWQRLQQSKDRPILQTANPLKTLRELFEIRKSHYAQADIHVTISKESLHKTRDKIIDRLAEFATKHENDKQVMNDTK